MKLCLGTVQFGLDYGLRGQQKPALEDSLRILDYAVHNGIEAIDTAAAYGNAEEIVGKFLERKTIQRERLFISSKVRPNTLDDIKPQEYAAVISRLLDETLARLHTDYLDGYLFHSSRYAFNDEMMEALCRLKQTGKIKRCGVSVYYPEEAKKCLQSSFVDFIQLPFSIFDQRMANEGVLGLASRCKTVLVHSRSVFVQGLALMGENEVPPFLFKAKPILCKMDKLCAQYGVSKIKFSLQFVKQFSAISHLVFGVDNLEQLKDNIKFFEEPFPREILQQAAKEFENIEADIVMPSLWVKK